jgi:hypothetical protein
MGTREIDCGPPLSGRHGEHYIVGREELNPGLGDEAPSKKVAARPNVNSAGDGQKRKGKMDRNEVSVQEISDERHRLIVTAS